MAIAQTEARPKTYAPKNTRLNEIIAIATFVLALLLLVCLVTFNPNDSAWNVAGEKEIGNWAGSIGAYISSIFLHLIGLASYLIPLMLFIVAWRRFRTRVISSVRRRLIGMALIVLSIAALLSLSFLPTLFDASVQPGGLLGAMIGRALSNGLNNFGSVILLLAIFAIGILLATDFSFARAYDYLVQRCERRFAFLTNIPLRFRTWREERRELARQKMQQRGAAQAEREAAQNESENKKRVTTAGRLGLTGLNGAFETEKEISTTTAIKRSASASTSVAIAEKDAAVIKPEVAAMQRRAIVEPMESATKRETQTTKETEDEIKAIESMVKDASVVRTEVKEEIGITTSSSTVIEKGKVKIKKPEFENYFLPYPEFLNQAPPRHEQADEELREIAVRVAEKCKEFNVTGKIEYICPGPVVTTYEFKPDPGIKYSRVTSLVDDLCLALKAESIRIDRVPGKAHVGIEVPNPKRETIFLREVIESRAFRESKSRLTIALGKTIDGLNHVADLTKMPHLLIAGATGSGKSVGVNSLVVSILYKARPDEVKFIMVDPKRLELGLYADIPHLATPIITDPKRATIALKWAVSEMERRYKELAGWGVRNIDGYNAEVLRRNAVEEFDENGEEWKSLPYIVIIIDELADLMMTSGNEVEESITRLAQMARAVGIHLVLATQRPSVDVITGLIKANFPSRISYRVSSKVDSRTILDSNGAEGLLGRGDMLFLPPGTSRLVRVHGAYCDENEINKIVSHVKKQGRPVYDETITQTEEEALGLDGEIGERDELFEDALRICAEMKRASTSVLQRRLRIGYGRAAAILDMMEREGYIGTADGARPRPVLGKSYETIAMWDSVPEDN
jgi:S-DNA-T family DNA segregation ATPase FtsK/SpoIIIE